MADRRKALERAIERLPYTSEQMAYMARVTSADEHSSSMERLGLVRTIQSDLLAIVLSDALDTKHLRALHRVWLAARRWETDRG